MTRVQVFDALRYDFDTRKRERCVRLDFPVQQGQGSIAGLEELEQLLKAAVKTSFETRAAAYEEEVCCMMLCPEMASRSVRTLKQQAWNHMSAG